MIEKTVVIRRWIAILFIIYLFYLIWAVLFKFSFSYAGIPFRRRYVNLDLFFNPSGSVLSPIIVREKVMNLLIFIPFGAYLYMLGSTRFVPSFLIMLCTSLLFETIQYAFVLGTSDIADVATNALGGIIGFLLMNLTFRLSKRKDGMLLHFAILAGITTVVVILGTIWLKLTYGG
ncbi:MAG: VanZ family protein [Lachnospiraceae bacterium]|nr:VanZ family protein [Lachnospiraceae bacterium]